MLSNVSKSFVFEADLPCFANEGQSVEHDTVTKHIITCQGEIISEGSRTSPEWLLAQSDSNRAHNRMADTLSQIDRPMVINYAM